MNSFRREVHQGASTIFGLITGDKDSFGLAGELKSSDNICLFNIVVEAVDNDMVDRRQSRLLLGDWFSLTLATVVNDVIFGSLSSTLIMVEIHINLGRLSL